MARYAIEQDGVAVNIILANSAEVASLIAAQQGATARLLAEGENPPRPEPVILRDSQLTKLQFLRRFTAQERIAIRASMNPAIADFLQLLDLAQDVRLDDPDTVAGVQYLEQETLLAAGRAAEILTP